jgi:hypothetical protein
MNNAGMAGALRAVDTDFATESRPSAAGYFKRVGRAVWGALCGTAFLGARASVHVVALTLAAVACVAGVVLYALQAAVGGRHG